MKTSSTRSNDRPQAGLGAGRDHRRHRQAGGRAHSVLADTAELLTGTDGI
jgi:hypothetical protein